MTLQGGIIAALALLALYLFSRLRQAELDRPIYRAECQQKLMEMQIRWSEANEIYQDSVESRLKALHDLMDEKQRLMDQREAVRDRRLADMELVLKTRLRFTP